MIQGSSQMPCNPPIGKCDDRLASMLPFPSLRIISLPVIIVQDIQDEEGKMRFRGSESIIRSIDYLAPAQEYFCVVELSRSETVSKIEKEQQDTANRIAKKGCFPKSVSKHEVNSVYPKRLKNLEQLIKRLRLIQIKYYHTAKPSSSTIVMRHHSLKIGT